VRSGHFPDYIVCDLLSRATLAVVVRHASGDLTPPGPRMVKAIVNGAAVLAETGPSPDLARMSRPATTIPCRHAVSRC
jgi:hypothetical protein